MKSPEQARNRHITLLALAAVVLAVYYGIVQRTAPEETLWGLTIRTITHSQFVSRQVQTNGTKFDHPLRILPIGDSITEGWLSGDGNGYRLQLRNRLVADGNDVDFIGARAQGDNNPDNQHEGYGGKMIAEIETLVRGDNILPQNPNIMLLMAGTNDIWHPPDDVPRSGAPDRLAHLIDYLLCKNNDTVLFVAAILQMNVGEDIENYNEQYVNKIPDIVQERYKKGYKIRMVNFFDIMTTDDLRDGIHPTDDGYHTVGDVWYSAINNIPKDWITQPRDKSTGGSGRAREECKTTGLWWAQQNGGNKIALGAQDGDDTGVGKDAEPWFYPLWPPLNYKAALGVGHNGSEILYADIDGDGFADYVWLVPTNGALVAWRNLEGSGRYDPINNAGIIAEGTGTAYGVHLVDLNGDKRADYVVLRDDGTMKVFLNYGQIDDGEYFWPELTNKKFPPGDTTAHNTVFGDLDGDGRKDILITNDDGTIDGYIQTNDLLKDDFYWLVCPGIAINNDYGELFMADLDGDGYDDFLFMDENGGITGFLNVPGQGPCGITGIPIGQKNGVAVGGWPRSTIRLADFDGDGKDDYLIVNVDDGSVDAWMNWGERSNITQMVGRGAGVRFADMNGDGLDDYIMVGPDTSAIGFWNAGPTANGDWSWPPMNNWKPIAQGVLGEIPGVGRHQIQFADMDGDGLADYLVVDEKTAAVYGYYNNGKQDGGWIEKGKIAEGPPYYGGSPGEGVRFGDLDGDGRDDYLWLDEDGLLLGFLNFPGGTDGTPSWHPLNDFHPIALGVGAKRQYVQFADLNGDGKVDYLWVHPEEGAVEVWWNGGPSTTDGSWQWIPGGRVAEGVGYPGLNVKFGRLTSLGRADYLGIEASTGAMVMYQNACKPGSVLGTTPGGDGSDPNDGTCSKPPLPGPDESDPNAPILIIPPPIGGEPIPPPGGGNTYTPPNEPPSTSEGPTPTSQPPTTSDESTSAPSSSPTGKDKGNVCNIDTTLGLCLDGTYPVYNEESKEIDCHPLDQVDSVIGDCQRTIDANAQEVQDWLNNDKSCCSDADSAKRDTQGGLASLFMRSLRSLGLAEEKRDPGDHGSYCEHPGQDPRSPPSGSCYATFTCNDALWPNVCGNAKSAILHRSKPSILTFHSGSEKHDVAHMENGRYTADKKATRGKGGWKLSGCDIEEYPWGASDPNRNKDKTAVIRLIPDNTENRSHGGSYPAWVKSIEKRWIAYQKSRGVTVTPQDGDQIVFCVEFRDGFDEYLPESRPDKNYCTWPFGVAAILFNSDEKTNAQGQKYIDYDPWFDVMSGSPQPRKITFTDHWLRNGKTRIYNPAKVKSTDLKVQYDLPPKYCRYPSPGNRVWDHDNLVWNIAEGTTPITERKDNMIRNTRCADWEGDLNERAIEWNETSADYHRLHSRDLGRRAFTQGFLDPAVYTFMGCAQPTDEDADWKDPCAPDGSAETNPDCRDNDPDDPLTEPANDDEDPGPNNPDDITTISSTATATPTDASGPFPTVSDFPRQTSDLLAEECIYEVFPSKRPRIARNDLVVAARDLASAISDTPLKQTDTRVDQFYIYRNTVVATYGWAANQDGCVSKLDNDPSSSVEDTVLALSNGCTRWTGEGDGSLGGGVVVNTVWGCVEVVVWGHLCQGCVQPP